MMSFIFVWHYGIFLSRNESVHFLMSSGYLCIALRDPVITGRGLSCVCPKISNIIYRGLWWLFVLLILVEYVDHHCLNCNFIILIEYRFIRKAHFYRFFSHNCCFALYIYVFFIIRQKCINIAATQPTDILVTFILLTPEWLGHMFLRWGSLLL